MIVLTCICVPKPGHEAECQNLVKELAARSQHHEGLIGYFWNLDEATQELHVIEVHADESSVLNHIALSDLSDLAAVSTFKDVKMFGPAPSANLMETLSGFGDVSLLTAL